MNKNILLFKNIAMRNITLKKIKICMLFACLFVMYIGNINSKAYGSDDVVTTCIWATEFNDDSHWEYCTIHGDIRNKETHTYEDNWYLGSESCHPSNFSTRICKCGHNYRYGKPHGNLSEWIEMTNRYIHYNICYSCNQWINPSRCYNENGLMSCKNLGTCLKCGAQPTKDMHYITSGGKCRDCGLKLINLSGYTLEYSSDYSSCKIIYTLSSAYEGFTLSGLTSHTSNTINYKSFTWSSVKNSDGSYTYTGEFIFNPNTQRKCKIRIPDIRDIGSIRGTKLYADESLYRVDIWQDHEKPVITNIAQTDQKTSNGWATIKQLTITGTDNLSAVVAISIIDKETGEVVVNNAKAAVINGSFRYTCTPPLEGPVEGREYICKVIDEVDNTLEHTFTIYKTDSKAPSLVSDSSYTQWSKTKLLTFKLTDYGSGGVETSLDDQVSYKRTEKNVDEYITQYEFAEENYGTQMYKLYMRDGLGNATVTNLMVGKIDNTKPTIIDVKTSLESSEVVATVTANDMNTKLRAEGSGVSRYAVTSAYVEPTTDQWQASNEIRVNNAGTYYIWVKDLVGNIGDVRKLKITDGVVTTDKIIYDSAKEKENIKENDGRLGKDKDKETVELYDDTPKTGDYREVKVYILYMIISFIGMTMIMLGVFVKKIIYIWEKDKYKIE